MVVAYAYFEITRTCLKCGRPLPVNGPVESVRCAACSTANPVPLAMFYQILQIAQANDEKLAVGETRTQTPIGHGGIYKLTWGVHPPACRACRAPLPDVPPSAGAFPCPKCGAACTTFASPDWLRRLHPGATQIYLGLQEIAGGDSAGAFVVEQSPTRPIAMRCARCGGGLSITADVPLEHACSFCGGRFRIPDEIWERMHPVETVQGWFVRLESPLPDMAGRLDEFFARYEEKLRVFERADGKMNRKLPGPSRFACLKIANTCGRCKAKIPVNGPVLHPICPTCGLVRNFPPEVIGELLAWVAEPEPTQSGFLLQGGHHFDQRRTRVPPFCRRCEADLPLVTPGADTTVECTRCGGKYPTFPVPAELRLHAGAARQVYCAERDSERRPVQAGAAVRYTCPSCGADLAIDAGTGRIHRCDHCGNDVFIPDEVWHQLHPVTEILPWFVDAGRVPASAEIARRAAAAAKAEQEAAKLRRQKLRSWTMYLAVAGLVAAALVILSRAC
jgi:DNA-directed RNA polymerase subunit RPC12/RpoP